jgi:hypothetical protein
MVVEGWDGKIGPRYKLYGIPECSLARDLDSEQQTLGLIVKYTKSHPICLVTGSGGLSSPDMHFEVTIRSVYVIEKTLLDQVLAQPSCMRVPRPRFQHTK